MLFTMWKILIGIYRYYCISVNISLYGLAQNDLEQAAVRYLQSRGGTESSLLLFLVVATGFAITSLDWRHSVVFNRSKS